ncbi:MAG: nicotinate-nucleotide adenylyltransferase [Deltaproteobacteria bacterium]|nr:nicotinate-nucleotide adenylyltransferase [Deltaproteobacteria bacterium]
MTIAIMGGTFNPVHYGHLRVAEEVRGLLNVDKVIFIPAFNPPHKDDDSFISSEHRIKMVSLAIEDNPAFEVSDREIRRGGASYSVETLRELADDEGEGDIHFIVGADSFNEITTWHKFEELFMMANIIVVPRPGYRVKRVEEALPVAEACKFWYDEARDLYLNDSGRFVKFMETTPIGISASGIRELVKRGDSVRYLIPPAVEGYIERERLYR